MITLTARINLLSNENSGNLIGVSFFADSSNNISSIKNLTNKRHDGSNPFILGASILDGNATLEKEVPYFIDNVAFEEDNFSPLNFRILGNNLKNVTILFDNYNNQYPTEIQINNIFYNNDDPSFTVILPPPIEEEQENGEIWQLYYFSINNWNNPKYPIRIQGIYVDITIEIDYRNLIALNRSITYRSDNKLPSYGIISNVGDLQFNDLDGEIRDYAEQMLLTSDLKVFITLNNTLAKTHEKVGIFETRSWDYDNDNRSVSVSLKDDLEEWQDIQVQGFDYDPREPFKVIEDGKMSNLYVWLQDKTRTPEKYKMLAFEQLDIKTQEILENTTIDYPFLDNSTLWEQWQKLCQVCGLYIYKNNNGETICTYTYGS